MMQKSLLSLWEILDSSIFHKWLDAYVWWSWTFLKIISSLATDIFCLWNILNVAPTNERGCKLLCAPLKKWVKQEAQMFLKYIFIIKQKGQQVKTKSASQQVGCFKVATFSVPKLGTPSRCTSSRAGHMCTTKPQFFGHLSWYFVKYIEYSSWIYLSLCPTLTSRSFISRSWNLLELYECLVSSLVLVWTESVCQPGSVGSTQTCALPYWTDQLPSSVCKQ